MFGNTILHNGLCSYLEAVYGVAKAEGPTWFTVTVIIIVFFLSEPESFLKPIQWYRVPPWNWHQSLKMSQGNRSIVFWGWVKSVDVLFNY